MGGIGGMEIFIILVVAARHFWTEKVARNGAYPSEKPSENLKSAGSDLQDELTKAAKRY